MELGHEEGPHTRHTGVTGSRAFRKETAAPSTIDIGGFLHEMTMPQGTKALDASTRQGAGLMGKIFIERSHRVVQVGVWVDRRV